MDKQKSVNVRIECGTQSSLDMLRPLWLCLHRHHQAIAPDLGPYVDDNISWATRRRFYEECLSHKDSFVLLAYSGVDLVGYALVLVQPTSSTWNDTWMVSDRTAELETLVVAPERRGEGIGGLLMNRVESEIARLDIQDVIVGALPNNKNVLNLYRRIGFEPTWLVMTRFAKRKKRGSEIGPSALTAEVRQAAESDIPEVERVVSEAYKGYIPRIGKPPSPMVDDYTLRVAQGMVWILTIGAETIGIVVIKPEAGYMLLENVAVRPGRQGEGFGRRLIDFAETRAREFGYQEIQLYTNAAMHENLALYPKLGYQEFRRGYDSGFHRVFFKKTLE
jgi:ribosomal protein S18 acetylase RimI-like enzyme